MIGLVVAVRSHRRGRKAIAAFTVPEFVIATAIVLLVVGAFAVFMQATGVTMVNLTTQSTFNQAAGNGAEYILSRVRLANTASNDSSGDILTLSFDDNPDVDSDGDKVTWNDLNHYEQFKFEPVDGSSSTLDDNRITYNANLGTATASVLISGGVRKLPGLTVFSVTNTANVVISFGLLFTNQTVNSQAIEIRTLGRLGFGCSWSR